MPSNQPTVVIVGAGFGGISAARSLKRFPGRVIVIDRQNHHLFQPLLYQVATCVLSPEQISTPIRDILAGQQNTIVLQGEVTGCDTAAKQITVSNSERSQVALPYDFLILATGVSLNYLDHPVFQQYAPGFKNLSDAT
jgi:NADH dehydrogenase